MKQSGKSQTKIIETLAADQVAALEPHRDRWLEVGLSIQPADRRLAERSVAVLYESVGLTAPEIIIWLRSPLEGAIGAALLRAKIQVVAQVGDQVWEKVWAQVRAQVRDQVGAQVGAQVRAQVRDQVGAQVGAQVWAQVRDQVGAQVGDQVVVGAACYGSHDAGWISFYKFFGAIGLKLMPSIDHLADLAQSCGWWWPFRGAVILTERPHTLRRDNRHRLHDESGPAIQYPDGFGVWAWHGVRVPREVIEQPESITADAIFAERNAEVRRVMIERYGRERLISDPRVKLVDRCDDRLAAYYRVRLGQDVEWGLLELQCHTTGKTTVIWARPDHAGVQEALARSFNFQRATEYAPARES